ncbi:hypothetical protein [Haladaptatus salinisoli]|uniref:hypothetical protein n=1 Tax=Haladaptatus salinisoli TaxID=2884876 RepID=UPI001D0A0086|nr:hypothetical protein [Haladaptatus salinisoli]
MPRSRRTLLKTTGLALSTGTLASAAGCLSDPLVGSNSSPDEPPTSSSSGGTATTDFTRWLPDPTTTPLRDDYGIRYFDIEGIRSHRDSTHENAYSRLESQMLGPASSEYVDAAAVDAAIQIDFHMKLALGSFDPKEIGEKITDDGQSTTATSTQSHTTATRTTWPEPERYRGFDLYGTEHVYAVSKHALMEVSPMREVDAVECAKAIIDTSAAKTSQYVDGNEYVAAMLGVVDAPHALWCYPEAMDGSTSRGFRKDIITGGLKSWRFGAETTHLTWANTYPDAETAESGELSNYIDSESDRFGAYDGLDVKIEGRMAWTDGTIPTEEFDHLAPGGPGEGVTTSHQSRRSPF